MRVKARVVGQVAIDPADHLTYDHADVRDADLSGLDKESFTSIGSRFERCRFDRMRVRCVDFGSGTEVSEYIDCSFDRSRLTMGPSGFERFVRCSFRDVDLRNWDCYSVDLVDCVFTGRLRTVSFWGALPPSMGRNDYEAHVRWREKQGLGPPPDAVRALMLRESNEFAGNDFSGADLVKVSFRGGVDLEAQRLPTGPDYLYLPDGRGTVDRAMAALDEYVADAALQPKVENFLNILGRSLDMGQRQLFLRESDFGTRGAPWPYIPVAFALLRHV